MLKPSTYKIKVQGELPEHWSDRLQGLSIIVDYSEENGPITTLEGTLRDQAALAGVLSTLYERRFPVLSVEQVKKPKG